jgi:hypothetical protein
MEMLGRARRAELLVQMQTYGAMATKLLRRFTAQTEALAKLKRGGEQTVRVEHVHVYPGTRQSSGRCRIGGEREGESIKWKPSLGSACPTSHYRCASGALLGPNQIGDSLPETCGEG